jgi:hypothetical protein
LSSIAKKSVSPFVFSYTCKPLIPTCFCLCASCVRRMRFEALSRNLVVLSSQSHGSFHGWAYKFHLTTQIRNLGYVIKTISVRSNAPFYAYNWLKHVLCRHSWSWESRNGLHPDPNSLPSLLSRLSLTSWYLTDLSTSMITTFDLTSFSALTSCFHRCEDRNFLTPAFC